MLVLTRRCDQEIRIGDDIRIRVVDVRGGQVRLGIDAPDHIPIERSELRERFGDLVGSGR